MSRGTRAQQQRRMAQSRRALRHRYVPPAVADRSLGTDAAPASATDADARAGRPLTDAEHQGVLEHDVDRYTQRRPPEDR
jgi:hypothetical protein